MTQPHENGTGWAAMAWWLERRQERENAEEEGEVNVLPTLANSYTFEGGVGSWSGVDFTLTEYLTDDGTPDALIISGGNCAPLAGPRVDEFRLGEEVEVNTSMQRHVCPGGLKTEEDLADLLDELRLSHEELVEKFMLFLENQFCSLYGRAYDIYSESGRRECAEFLARSTEGALAL